MTAVTPTPIPPTIVFKAQRVLRTIVAGLIVLVPIVNVGAASIIGYLQSQTDIVIPGWVFAILNGALVGTALLMGLVSRIMAIPGVNALLVKIGLGSVPKSALTADSAK